MAAEARFLLLELDSALKGLRGRTILLYLLFFVIALGAKKNNLGKNNL